MKFLKLNLLLLFIFNMGVKVFSQSYEKQFIWEKRVIIVVAETPVNEYFKTQMNILGGEKNGLDERDLIVLSNFSDDISAGDRSVLYEKYGSTEKPFTIVLLGKDGGVKLKRHAPVSADELYTLIDSMPMRRREMKDQKR